MGNLGLICAIDPQLLQQLASVIFVVQIRCDDFLLWGKLVHIGWGSPRTNLDWPAATVTTGFGEMVKARCILIDPQLL